MKKRFAFAESCPPARPRIAVGLSLVLCVLTLGLSAYAQPGTFITFDAPGAGTGIDQGTYPVSINPFGVVAGYFYDGNGVAHGFVRTLDGNVTVFDPSGSTNTFVHAINLLGVITGDYYDANSVDHGFVRYPYGTFSTFDVPGAIFFSPAGDIDTLGAVTGSYADTNLVLHGFLRTANGNISTIDAPGAFSMPNYGMGTQLDFIQSGCVTKRISQALEQRARDFYRLSAGP